MEQVKYLPAGELWVRPEGYLHLIWNDQSQDSDAAKAVFYEVLCLLKTMGYRRLLTDQRGRATATEDYMGWLLALWLPRAAEANMLSHVAVVHARALELRLQAVDICAQGLRRYGIVSRFFTTPQDAHDWLLQPAG